MRADLRKRYKAFVRDIDYNRRGIVYDNVFGRRLQGFPLFLTMVFPPCAPLPGGSRNLTSGYTNETRAVEPRKNRTDFKNFRLFTAPPLKEF